jgi:predicted ATPase
MSFFSAYLATAYAELGRFNDAWRCIRDTMTTVETTKERWCEAEVHRVAGEIALMMPKPDAAEAEAYFERALAVARKQQAKSWELRAILPASLAKTGCSLDRARRAAAERAILLEAGVLAAPPGRRPTWPQRDRRDVGDARMPRLPAVQLPRLT